MAAAMTPPSDTDVRELVERLHYWQGDGHPHGLLHGEAATALESLLQDRARMEEALREIENDATVPDRVRRKARAALSRSG
jgi:hypothetical protein